MAGREGFEPPEVLPSTVFKTAALSRSAISRQKSVIRFSWRRHPDLNRGSRLCRPMPYRLAISPPNPIKWWCPEPDLNRHRKNSRGILSPLRLPISPSGQRMLFSKCMERETRFELATPTLARSCSTTELFPHLKKR